MYNIREKEIRNICQNAYFPCIPGIRKEQKQMYDQRKRRWQSEKKLRISFQNKSFDLKINHNLRKNKKALHKNYFSKIRHLYDLFIRFQKHRGLFIISFIQFWLKLFKIFA